MNPGTVIGTPFGVYEIGGTVTNTGTVIGTSIGRATAIGVELRGGAWSIPAISGPAASMRWAPSLLGGGTIDNSGLLVAAGANTSSSPVALTAIGAYLNGGGTLINSGSIFTGLVGPGSTSSTPAGILVTGTVGVVIDNFGAILSGDGIFVETIETVGTATIDPKPNVTLVDAGLVSGTLGTAVRFGDGNNLFTVQPGATLVGTVTGGTGSNTLEFGTGTAAATACSTASAPVSPISAPSASMPEPTGRSPAASAPASA